MMGKCNHGKIIAAMGLPCSGKSSVIKKASEIVKLKAFVEPEESSWPDAVNMSDQMGGATASMWFRSIRVPMLIKAKKLRDEGHIVLVDNLNDKLLSKYLGFKGTEWMVHPNDPYFSVISEIAQLDYELLPEVDCVVSFDVSNSKWLRMVASRNRDFDMKNHLNTIFNTKNLYLYAAIEYSTSIGIPHIVFENELDSVSAAARKLIDLLSKNKIIN